MWCSSRINSWTAFFELFKQTSYYLKENSGISSNLKVVYLCWQNWKKWSVQAKALKVLTTRLKVFISSSVDMTIDPGTSSVVASSSCLVELFLDIVWAVFTWFSRFLVVASVFWNHIVLKRDQFVICMNFFGIDTSLVFFRNACLVFLGKNCRLAFFPRLCILFFSSMRFLVLLSVRGLPKFSKIFNLDIKVGRHLFSVNLFISKVIFFRSTSCTFVFTIATIFARDPRQQCPFMYRCSSTLNTLSSIANQTVSLPLAMRFYWISISHQFILI